MKNYSSKEHTLPVYIGAKADLWFKLLMNYSLKYYYEWVYLKNGGHDVYAGKFGNHNFWKLYANLDIQIAQRSVSAYLG